MKLETHHKEFHEGSTMKLETHHKEFHEGFDWISKGYHITSW